MRNLKWSLSVKLSTSECCECEVSNPPQTTYRCECWWCGVKRSAVGRHCLHCRNQASYIRSKNVNTAWSYESTANTGNVFETGITLPGRSELSLAVTTPCRLQLCAVSWSVTSRLSGYLITRKSDLGCRAWAEHSDMQGTAMCHRAASDIGNCSNIHSAHVTEECVHSACRHAAVWTGDVVTCRRTGREAQCVSYSL